MANIFSDILRPVTGPVLTAGVAAPAKGVWSPYRDTDLLAYYSPHSVEVASGAVSRWSSRGPYGNVIQATEANRPAYSGGKATGDGTSKYLAEETLPYVPALIGAIALPDASGGATGEGFTCTGLSRLSDGRWAVGNDGRSVFGDTSYQSSVVISEPGNIAAKQLEHLAATYVTGAQSVQGVAVTPADTIWFVVKQQQKLVHITASGTLLATLDLAFIPNALGWDTIADCLIVGQDNTTVTWIDPADGSTVKTRTMTASIDQLQFLPRGEEGLLLTTEGTNGVAGIARFYDIATSAYLQLSGSGSGITLNECLAIEGVFYELSTGKLCVVNDAYFHNGTAGGNQAIEYTIAPPVGSKLLVVAVVEKPVAQASSTAFFALGDPAATTTGGFGIFALTGVTNGLRVISQTGTGSSTRDTIDWTVDLSAKVMISVEVDFFDKTISAYANGALVSTQALVNAEGAGIDIRRGPTLLARHSGITETITSYSNGSIYEIGASASLAQRQRWEGHLAWGNNLQGSLPSDHPYKFRRPR